MCPFFSIPYTIQTKRTPQPFKGYNIISPLEKRRIVMLLVQNVLDWTEGILLQGKPEVLIREVHFDSRQLHHDALFVALTTGRRDGHQFIESAIQNGAIAILLSKDDSSLRQKYPQIHFIYVKNTEKAFQTMAASYRKQLNLPVIAVTGSNGKTTTKDMIAHLLKGKFNVHKTYKNLNNHLGVPLSLLSIRPDHDMAVLEMGMNKAGEISFLARIAQPNISVITNIGEAHIQFFGTREKIAQAKGEILPETDPSGFVLLNGDDPFVLSQARRYQGQVFTYSILKQADIYATDITYSESGSSFNVHLDGRTIPCFMPLLGEHNISNVLPAIFIAERFNIDLDLIKERMISLTVSEMRFQTMEGPNGSILVNDAYNASPTSVKAAARTFAQIYPERKKVLVLGDIFELGEHAESFHIELGHYLKGKPFTVITVGENSALISEVTGGIHCRSHQEAAHALTPYLTSQHAILFKGSRGMQMEKVIDHLFQSIL
jgi:UDP-N-acetylmuramoyl-tripeptide--D-alanyl-D-alanine ligase